MLSLCIGPPKMDRLGLLACTSRPRLPVSLEPPSVGPLPVLDGAHPCAMCISAFTSFWQASIHACFVLPSGIRMIAFQLDGVFVISSPTMVIACIVSLPAGYHALASRLTLLTEPVSMSRTSVRPARSAVPCRMTSASVHFFRLLRS